MSWNATALTLVVLCLGPSLASAITPASTTPTATVSGPASFPDTATGSVSAAAVFTLTNSGNLPITSAAVTLTTGDFVYQNGSCNAQTLLRPGDSCTANVYFAPKGTAGSRAATLSFRSPDLATPVALQLSGNAVASVATATIAGPASFPDTAIGIASSTFVFTVSNAGNVPITSTAITLTTGDFVYRSGSCISLSVLQPGDSCTANLYFAPKGTTGSRAATLTVKSPDLANPVTQQLSGNAVAALAAASVAGTASFPDTATGNVSATTVFTLTNSGNLPITSAAVTLTTGDFVYRSGSCISLSVLQPGDSCTANVYFAPKGTAGSRAATLSFRSPDLAAPVTLQLSGNAVAAVATATIAGPASFPDTAIGIASSTFVFMVSNTGNVPITSAAITLTTGDFVYRSGSCISQSLLQPGDSCTANLYFAPRGTPGSRAATLTVRSPDLANPVTQQLSGTAIATSSTAVAAPGPATTTGSNSTATSPPPAQVPRTATSATAPTSCTPTLPASKAGAVVAMTRDVTVRDSIAKGQICRYSASIGPGTYVVSLTGIVGAAELRVYSDAAFSKPVDCLAPNLVNSTFAQAADCSFVVNAGTVYATVTSTSYLATENNLYNIRVSPRFAAAPAIQGTQESPMAIQPDRPFGGTVGAASGDTSYYVVNTAASGDVVISMTGLTDTQLLDLAIYDNAQHSNYKLNNKNCYTAEFNTFAESCVLPAGQAYYLAVRNTRTGGPFTLMADTPAKSSPASGLPSSTSLLQQAAPSLGKRPAPGATSPPAPAALPPAAAPATP